MSMRDSIGFSPKTKTRYDDSKLQLSPNQTMNDLSSDFADKYNKICERCSSEDATVVCIRCENVYLCPSCDDLIHSIGVYKNHDRKDVIEFIKSLEKSATKAQEETTQIRNDSSLTKEERDLTNKLLTKLESLSTKIYECDVVIKSYETKEKELEINFESSCFNVENNMKYLRELIKNKENELILELKAIKEEKINEITTLKQKITNLKATVTDVCEIIKEGIRKPKFTLTTGLKFVNKRVELCEDEISSDLMNREVVSINLFKLIDVTPLNNLLSTIKFQSNSTSNLNFDDKDIDELVIDTEENQKEIDDIDLKEDDLEVKLNSLNRYGSSISLQQEKPSTNLKKETDSMQEASRENQISNQMRSRADHKKGELRQLKRPMSSYGSKKDYSSGPPKRIPSTTSPRQNLFNRQKLENSKKDIPHPNSSRYTPKSKDRNIDGHNSFVEETKRQIKGSSSFVANSQENPTIITNGGNKNNSLCGDNAVPQIDEEEEKRLICENPLRKRVFIHVAQTSTSVQVAWSHSSKIKSDKKIHYILEYGVGIKMKGEEQFRTIYNGKAHKCIITDLMPRTAYRFKVVPFKVDENGKEEHGECSEIKQINTYDLQDINPSSLGHHANIIMK